ncbi:unnamed protein product, partial [Polarella glacialis]
MELFVLESFGLPTDGVLSVRCGSSRRQSPLPCTVPFQLPKMPWPLRIEAMAWRGWSRPQVTLEAGSIGPDGLFKVPLESHDGHPMSVTFRLQVLGPPDGDSKVALETSVDNSGIDEALLSLDAGKTVKKKEKEIAIDAYLSIHDLNGFMRTLFAELISEQPEDPYAFIARRLHQASDDESRPLAAGDGSQLGRPPKVQVAQRRASGGGEGGFSVAAQKATAPGGGALPLKSALAAPKAPEALLQDAGRRRTDSKRVRLSTSLLRQRAQSTLARAHSDGRLSDAIEAVKVAGDRLSALRQQ